MELPRAADSTVCPPDAGAPVPHDFRLAPALLETCAAEVDESAQQQMAQTVTGWLVEGLAGRHRPAHVSVRVCRRLAGVPQVLFVFAGAVDAHALRAVMQQVLRLTRAAQGGWGVEVIATGLDGPLLLDVESTLWELQRSGTPVRLAHAPQLRPEFGALLAPGALMSAQQ